MCEIISLSDTEELGELREPSEPISAKPRFSTPTVGIDDEVDLTTVGFLVETSGQVALPVSRRSRFEIRSGIDEPDPFHDARVFKPDVGVFLGDERRRGGRGLGQDPMLEFSKVISLTGGGKRTELFNVPVFAAVVRCFLRGGSGGFEMRTVGQEEVTDTAEAVSLFKYDEPLKVGGVCSRCDFSSVNAVLDKVFVGEKLTNVSLGFVIVVVERETPA